MNFFVIQSKVTFSDKSASGHSNSEDYYKPVYRNCNQRVDLQFSPPQSDFSTAVTDNSQDDTTANINPSEAGNGIIWGTPKSPLKGTLGDPF